MRINRAVAVDDKRVATTSRNPLIGNVVVEAPGHLILPGFVDAHVHTRSSEEEGLTAVSRFSLTGATLRIFQGPGSYMEFIRIE